MIFAKVKNNIVENIAVFKEPPGVGWEPVEEGSSVGVGWKMMSDGTLSDPVTADLEKTTEQKIEQLESKVTQRIIRGSILGDQYSIKALEDIENEIAVLRAEL